MRTVDKVLEIINSKKAWVVNELDGLISEWESWQLEVAQIKDHPYDTNTQSNVFADGEENMDKHEILQTKTLTFLNNNIRGHGFIVGFDISSLVTQNTSAPPQQLHPFRLRRPPF